MVFQCPKNFKRGKYLFGKYRWIDLIILFGCGCVGLFTALAIVSLASALKSFVLGVIGLCTGILIMLVGGLLTLPVNHYHNMLEWLNTIIDYFARTRRFVWIGFNWSDDDEEDSEIVIMKLIKEDEEYSFETIDSDEEFDRVSTYLEELSEEE